MGLKDFGFYLLIHGGGLLLSFLLFAVLITLKEHIDKIFWAIRLILIPFVMVLSLIAISGLSNNILALLALFWSSYDVDTNILFYSNVIIPAATSYVLLWSVHFTAPFKKFYITCVVGILCRMLKVSNQMLLAQHEFHDSYLYIVCIYALWLVFL